MALTNQFLLLVVSKVKKKNLVSLVFFLGQQLSCDQFYLHIIFVSSHHLSLMGISTLDPEIPAAEMQQHGD